MANSMSTLSRRDRYDDLRRLVPAEVAAAHQRVRAAAGQPGIVDPQEAVTLADDALLEVAALLAGRTPSSAAQHRYVAVRVTFLDDLAAALEERGQLWQEAAIELDALWPLTEDAVREPSRDGFLVATLVVVLSPFLLTWDLLCGLGRGGLTIAHAAARGLRTAWSSVVQRVRRMLQAVLDAVRRWRAYRDRIKAAAREARARMIAARLRVRLRFRRLRAARLRRTP